MRSFLLDTNVPSEPIRTRAEPRVAGTYVSVAPYHLFRYLDEKAFRYNERKHEYGDSGRLQQVVKGIHGRRLTYKELTGKTQTT